MTRYYTGVGSRETPRSICVELTRIARVLRGKDYTLRSGGAQGADEAFGAGAGRDRVTYRPVGVPTWAFEEAAKYIPADRCSFASMGLFARKLLARDMLQVLGRDGNEPSLFLVCWTPLGIDDGGTGYAIRCAKAHGVPVYNLNNETDSEVFYQRLGE